MEKFAANAAIKRLRGVLQNDGMDALVNKMNSWEKGHNFVPQGRLISSMKNMRGEENYVNIFTDGIRGLHYPQSNAIVEKVPLPDSVFVSPEKHKKMLEKVTKYRDDKNFLDADVRMGTDPTASKPGLEKHIFSPVIPNYNRVAKEFGNERTLLAGLMRKNKLEGVETLQDAKYVDNITATKKRDKYLDISDLKPDNFVYDPVKKHVVVSDYTPASEIPIISKMQKKMVANGDLVDPGLYLNGTDSAKVSANAVKALLKDNIKQVLSVKAPKNTKDLILAAATNSRAVDNVKANPKAAQALADAAAMNSHLLKGVNTTGAKQYFSTDAPEVSHIKGWAKRKVDAGIPGLSAILPD